MLQGQCLCGAIRARYEAVPRTLTVCHCGMCRRWHGSLGAYVGGKPADYRLEGGEHLRWYGSSPGAERGFCGICGSKMFWRSKDGKYMDIAVGVLDQPTGLATSAHIWVRDKGDYYGLPEDAPCFEESADGVPQAVDPCPPVARELSEREGHCLCGGVSFRVRGKMRDVVWCHCGQCLRWHGHYGGYTAGTRPNIELHGQDKITWYKSSEAARRGFCRDCGSNLFWEGVGRDYVSIAAGALEMPTGLVTARHIFVESKGDYYRISDGVAQTPGTLAAHPVTF
ncbi:MAG: GFA family protein [Dongiaceae bacterium]